VLVDGRITETGTHEELLQRQRHYWSLYMSTSRTAHNSQQPETPRPKTPYWQITRMSELDRYDLELIEAVRTSGIKVTSLATQNIAVELVRE
jgi:post-segregation antitoxin (ccd killing protein)